MRTKILVGGLIATAVAGLTVSLSAGGASAAPSAPTAACGPVQVIKGEGGRGTLTFTSSAASAPGQAQQRSGTTTATAVATRSVSVSAPAGAEGDTVCATLIPAPAQQ